MTVIAVDTNILVYAHRVDLPFHPVAARRVTELAEGAGLWGIPWPCVHEFFAVVTHPRTFRAPTPVGQALAFLGALRDSGRCVFMAEPESHWDTLSSLATQADLRGGQIHNARIAAICLGHGVRELWSADRDFSRYPTLRVRNPLVADF